MESQFIFGRCWSELPLLCSLILVFKKLFHCKMYLGYYEGISLLTAPSSQFALWKLKCIFFLLLDLWQAEYSLFSQSTRVERTVTVCEYRICTELSIGIYILTIQRLNHIHVHCTPNFQTMRGIFSPVNWDVRAQYLPDMQQQAKTCQGMQQNHLNILRSHIHSFFSYQMIHRVICR